MHSILRFLAVVTISAAAFTSTYAAEPTPSVSPKPRNGLLLMPSSDDIAKDVVREKAADDQKDERAIASSLREAAPLCLMANAILRFALRTGHCSFLPLGVISSATILILDYVHPAALSQDWMIVRW